MEKDCDYYLSLGYKCTIIRHKKSGRIQVIYPQLPGCVGWTSEYLDIQTFSESLLKSWITNALQDGYRIPEP